MDIHRGDIISPPQFVVKRFGWWSDKEYEVIELRESGVFGVIADDGDFYSIDRMRSNHYLKDGGPRCFIHKNFSLENK